MHNIVLFLILWAALVWLVPTVVFATGPFGIFRKIRRRRGVKRY
jgi:hypothetical protein